MVLDSQIVKELVEQIAGKDVVILVELIKGKEDVSEFKIAEKLNLTVNQVRNMLYRLYSHNLVYFTRKKDKRKGWYIYYWTFDEKKAYNLFLKVKKEKLNLLRDRLVNENQGSYFVCSNPDCGSVRMSFEDAMEHDFKCPDCGRVLEQDNNSKRITFIEKEIEEINRQLATPYVETSKKTSRKSRRKAGKKPAKKKGVKKTIKKKIVKRKPPRKHIAKKKFISKSSFKKKNSRKKR